MVIDDQTYAGSNFCHEAKLDLPPSAQWGDKDKKYFFMF